MGAVPKLMVLSTSLPGTRHGGGVVQDAILRSYPRDRYVCVSLKPPAWGSNPDLSPPSLKGVPYLLVPVTPEPRWRGARFYLPLLRVVGFTLAAPWRVRQAVAFGRHHGVDMVWAELQGEAVLLAARVAAGLKVPLAGTVWDDADGWLMDGGYDPFCRRLLLVRYREALHAALRISTVSEAMQSDFRRRYHLTSSLLRYGHDAAAGVVVPERRRRGNILVGFAGNVYGEDAWGRFLVACARLNGAGRWPPIKIMVFGSEGFPYPHPGVEVISEGWLPEQEMLRRLAAADFCYLPYWFTPGKRRHAEFSFLTKLTTYLAAGRPVLYHGPAYASITRTIQQYNLGTLVCSLDLGEVVAALNRFIADDAGSEVYSRAARVAFQTEFNGAKMRRNFAELIGVTPDVFNKNG